MLLNPDIANEVSSAWTADQNHPSRGRAQRPVPPVTELELLIDIVFGASLLREEGTPILTSIAWITPNDFDAYELGRQRQSLLALKFDTPLELTAHTLAKLNKIGNGKTASLLACLNDQIPVIWGIGYYGGTTSPLGQVPAMAEEVRHFRPDCPTITVTGTGSFQVSRAGSVIGYFENGRFSRAQPTVLTSYMLGQYLYGLLGLEIDFTTRRFKNATEEQSQAGTALVLCIEYVIEVLSQRRSGATIIFVPSSQQRQALSEFSTAWSVSGSLEIETLQRTRTRLSQMAHSTLNMGHSLVALKIDQGIRERLRNLIDLANIDGALLLTPSFEVLGFGAKLKSPKWTMQCEHGPVLRDEDKQPLDFSRLGTRHNSALDFVGSVDGAIAFVASADGPIRAMVKSTMEKVWYWPDCRVSMSAR